MRKIILAIIILLIFLSSCSSNDEQSESLMETDEVYMNKNISFSDLDIESDVENGFKIRPYLIYEDFLYYGELTPPATFFHLRDTADKIIQYNLKNDSISEKIIVEDSFAHLFSMVKVGADTYSLVVFQPTSETDPYTIKVIKNWQTSNEIELDKYDIPRLELVSKIIKIDDKLYYTKLNEEYVVELKVIEEERVDTVDINVDKELVIPFSMSFLSSDNSASFTLIKDNYVMNQRYTSSLIYYYDDEWKSISKENSYLFSALPVKNRYLVDEVLPDDSMQLYWFDPETKAFNPIDVEKDFGVQRRVALDYNSFLAINENFNLLLFEIDENYNISHKIITDENIGRVYSIFKESDTSVIVEVNKLGTFDSKFVRIQFSE